MYFKEYVESYIVESNVEIDGKLYKSKKEAEADMKSKGYTNSKIKNKLEHARIAHGKLKPEEQLKLAKAAAGSIGSDLIGGHYMSHKIAKDGTVRIYSTKGHHYYMPPGAKHAVEHSSLPDLQVKNKIQKELEAAHERMVKKAKEEADKD
jgi:hypothetical protein